MELYCKKCNAHLGTIQKGRCKFAVMVVLCRKCYNNLESKVESNDLFNTLFPGANRNWKK